ncbi:hypothetical protein E4U13_000357 [Claviceps humidiphila]|uniref:Uncharacterized protein n=2 Tax=Claviceps TaxID=5110 RepID=A0A9P7TM74_9HYPO|nr:hypothetical protein E4U13_000357 [Claviceps humidiphila]
MWEYAVVSGHEKHNHKPPLHAVAHPIHRRRTAEYKKTIRELSALGIKACEIAERLKLQYPEALVTGRDIENERQTARRDALAQTHHEPVKAPAKDKPKDGTPEWVYAKYKFARTKWFEDNKDKLPVHLRTHAVYRAIKSLGMYSESDYAECGKYMGKECISVSPNRPWTEEEMMAWCDDDYRRNGVADVDAEKEHADNNFSFPGRGLRDLLPKINAQIAAEELEWENDDEYEL